jgi:hypothetical protein
MKQAQTIAIAIIIIIVLTWIMWGHHLNMRLPQTTSRQIISGPSVGNSIATAGRLNELEKDGEIPEGDHDIKDWQLAQKTSWWGKSLDPKGFWKGRIVWNDKKAILDAHRHGRLYPPIPYQDTNLPPYPNDDGFHDGFGAEGPNIVYAWSGKEAGFWDRFDKTTVRPPDQIDQAQYSAAAQLLRAGDSDIIRDEPISRNFPAQAFTTNALYWAYVESKRTEYQSLIDNGGETNDSELRSFFGMLLVDRALVTQPLTSDQVKAAAVAMAWRISYLQELQSKNADTSYINAYLQAWNLSSNQVFGSGN